MNTEDHTIPRPGGLTLKKWRTRNSKPFVESNSGPQVLSASVGLNTSGALSGIKASSFPNPVLAPPPPQSVIDFCGLVLQNEFTTAPALPHQIR